MSTPNLGYPERGGPSQTDFDAVVANGIGNQWEKAGSTVENEE